MEMEKENSSQWSNVFDKIPNQMQQSVFAGLAFIGNLCLGYEEQLRMQEKQNLQNEDIKAIRLTLEQMRQEQERLKEGIQKERREWGAERERYEESLRVLRDEMEGEIQKLTDVKMDLERRVRKYEEDLGRIARENETDRELLERQYEADKRQLVSRYEEYQANVKKEYQEIQEEWSLYHRYREWIRGDSVRILLNRLESGCFEAFIVCCGKKPILKYIFDQISIADIWGWKEEDIAILDSVINCCIRLQNLNGSNICRAETQAGSAYDSMHHIKREDAPSGGRITKVLLQGIMENGSILENCRSYVELDSE